MISRKATLFRLGAILISTLLLYLCLRKVDFQALWREVQHVKLSYLLPGFGCYFLIILVKSTQIRTYLSYYKKLSLLKIARAVSILLMTGNLIPFWGGHALFVYLLGHRERVGKTRVLSAITLDQIIEGFGKIFLFAVVALTSPLPDWMRRGMLGLTLTVLLAYGIFFYLATRFRNHPLEREEIKPRLLGKIFHLLLRLVHQLQAIRSLRIVLLTILLSIIMKSLEATAIFLVQKSFGIHLPFSASFLVAASLSLGTILPLSPGRLGVFEAAIFVAYRYLNVGATEAMTLAIFTHMVHTLPFVISGYMASLKTGLQLSPPDEG